MSASPSNGGLPSHAAERLRSVFALHPTVETVTLFGSRAKDNAKRGSDIDLAVSGPCSDSELGSIFFELDDLLLPWEIDLVALDQIRNPALREHIERVGQAFYASPKAAA